MKTICCILPLGLLALACAPRETILTVPAVSMTHPAAPEGKALKPAGRIEAEYCKGDDSEQSKGEQNIGLIDEAVLKAQRESEAVYLSDVTISQQGSCVLVEAMAMR